MRTRRLLAVTVLVAGALALAACGGSAGDATGDTTTTQGSTMTQGSNMTETTDQTIIDVRTPEEFAEGHVQGAVNLNVEDGTLEARLASLDPAKSYSVYCRSGRRSALAAELMASKGFMNVSDLGALESAASTLQLPIVND